MSHKSVLQECPTRASCKSVECPTRVFRKSVLQECRVSYKSVPQECPARVSRKSVECPIRVSYKSVQQQCPTRASHKSTLAPPLLLLASSRANQIACCSRSPYLPLLKSLLLLLLLPPDCDNWCMVIAKELRCVSLSPCCWISLV